MQNLITSKQAKQITGGRTPLTIESYERAVAALQETIDVIDAMKWANLADAYATVSKIHNDEKALRLSKILKLHAYRRMGQLALEIRPTRSRVQVSGFGKEHKNLTARIGPGANSLLQDSGLQLSQANASLKLAKLSDESFAALTAQAKPPAPSVYMRATNLAGISDSWRTLRYSNRCLYDFTLFCKQEQASALASGLKLDEVATARGMVRAAIDWLDEFEQHLPKVKP